MTGLGHSRHHAIPARPLRLKSGHQTRGQSRLVAFESVEEQPRTTAGRHPGWRGAPVATTRLSSMRISRSISPSSSAIFRSRWANGNGVFAIRSISPIILSASTSGSTNASNACKRQSARRLPCAQKGDELSSPHGLSLTAGACTLPYPLSGKAVLCSTAN